MTQEEYNLICKIIAHGAPALANELIASLSLVVNEWQTLKKDIPKGDSVPDEN